jgi:phosphoribosylanthranilate isomerase
LVKQILKTDLPIYAIDVNSKFEIEAGLKNKEKLDRFKQKINF